MTPSILWQTATRVHTMSWQVAWLVVLALRPQAAAACRYTVRDVAMVDLAEPHYVLCLVTQGELAPSQTRSLAAAAAPILADSNVEFRLLDARRLEDDQREKDQSAIEPVDVFIQAALGPLAITSYPAAVLLAPDGRTLQLPLADDGLASADHSIPVASLRPLLRSAIESPRRDELLHFLLRGHSVVLVVEGSDGANNQRAISWVEDAIEQVRDALPSMAKPIELPPRLVRFSAAETKREMVLLWSLGVDLPQEVNPPGAGLPVSAIASGLGRGDEKESGQGELTSQQPGREREPAATTQIALLFGRGRKLGPVLRIPGSRQQDLWRSLGVVGVDCECGLDRSWMRGPMIPHAWSTTDEADAVAALGFDPGNPLVKAEISRILARGSMRFGKANPGLANQSLQELFSPQLELVEIDIDELTAAANTRTVDATAIHSQPAQDISGVAGRESPAPQTEHPDGLPGSHPDTLKSAQTLATVPPTKGTPTKGIPTKGTPEKGPPATGQVAAPRVEDIRTANLSRAAGQAGGGTSTARKTITWILMALGLVGVLGSLGLILRGWRKQV